MLESPLKFNKDRALSNANSSQKQLRNDSVHSMQYNNRFQVDNGSVHS